MKVKRYILVVTLALTIGFSYAGGHLPAIAVVLRRILRPFRSNARPYNLSPKGCVLVKYATRPFFVSE